MYFCSFYTTRAYATKQFFDTWEIPKKIVTAICRRYGVLVLNTERSAALLEFCAFTGCDQTGKFSSHSKLTCWKTWNYYLPLLSFSGTQDLQIIQKKKLLTGCNIHAQFVLNCVSVITVATTMKWMNLSLRVIVMVMMNCTPMSFIVLIMLFWSNIIAKLRWTFYFYLITINMLNLLTLFLVLTFTSIIMRCWTC